jgi:hypothetical protein
MPQVIYHRLIDRDIRCALDYYESEGGSRLADRFFADVQATVGAIEQSNRIPRAIIFQMEDYVEYRSAIFPITSYTK